MKLEENPGKNSNAKSSNSRKKCRIRIQNENDQMLHGISCTFKIGFVEARKLSHCSKGVVNDRYLKHDVSRSQGFQSWVWGIKP